MKPIEDYNLNPLIRHAAYRRLQFLQRGLEDLTRAEIGLVDAQLDMLYDQKYDLDTPAQLVLLERRRYSRDLIVMRIVSRLRGLDESALW